MTGPDYLWDGTGPPDPEIERLEHALRPLRHSRGAPALPARTPQPAAPRWAWWMAAAAAAVLAVAVSWPWLPARADRWAITWLEGSSWDDARVARESQLGVGQWVETGQGRARLAVGDIGQIELEPGTRVGLIDAGRTVHRLSVERGSLRALIWAPPGQFVVDTPSAIAVDLGCQYTLEVTENGSGVLRVEVGWVGFLHRGVRSLVPAGAVARTRAGRGPGTPYFADASPAFAASLDDVDFGDSRPAARAALDVVLADARPRDALSLWHLLARLDEDDAALVYARLAALVPPPASVTQDGVLRRDEPMLDAWWNEMGFGSAASWREWTAPWVEAPAANMSH